jgi:hypothetical protein
MKSKKTRKKFYNKWLCKVTLSIEGIGIFRIYDLDSIRDKLTVNDQYNYHADKAQKNKKIIIDLAELLKSFSRNQWAKRIEGSCIDIYTNEHVIYQSICDQFKEYAIHFFKPDPGSEEFLDDKKSILAKKFPHDRYRYKVYLLPHKMSKEIEEKNRYVTWIKKQIPQITFTESVERWFKETNWNWDRRYILVEDEKTLLMLKLRNPEIVGRIYNYVICDK